MIEIALCDDAAADIEKIRAYAERFADEHPEYPMRLSAFSSAAALLRHIGNGSGFDLYILDILMPRMSGIKLAEKIRSRGCRGEIVFLTCSADYAVDAFSVYASGYVLKPVRKEELDRTLLWAVQKLAQQESKVIIIKTKNGLRRIPLSKIVMIESFDHIRTITMSDGSALETSATLSELFEQLKEHSNFYMPHRAYIANLDNSVGIVRYDLLMLGNRRIPIPKSQYAAIKDFVQDYFFKRKSL